MKHGGPTPATVSLGFGLSPGSKVPKTNEQESLPTSVQKPRIVVADSDPEMRRVLQSRLTAAQYSVSCVESAQEALDAGVRCRPHLVITELKLEPMDGLALLKELKSRWPEITVIILTAHGTIPDAVRATQAGAFGFLVKPVDREELLGQVKRAIAASSYSNSNGDWRANIVSRSRLMEDRLAQANHAAAVNSPVLLIGQNGTGKELLARAIHAASPRRERNFITINCRGADLASLEADIFGAPDGTPGALQQVDGGTLLLEEIGDLPLRLQARLVNEVHLDACRPVLADNARKVDVRLICTASKDLTPYVANGEFRQDLYYQINVMPIEVPPLGRRREDIPLLVSHFLEQATEGRGTSKIYTPAAIELLATTDWPGNVRQLFDLVKRNVALSHGKVMNEDLVRESLGEDTARLPSLEEARNEFSREYLTRNLTLAGGNVTEAARLAKRNRTEFYSLLARFRLNAADFKHPGPAVSTVKQVDAPVEFRGQYTGPSPETHPEPT